MIAPLSITIGLASTTALAGVIVRRSGSGPVPKTVLLLIRR